MDGSDQSYNLERRVSQRSFIWLTLPTRRTGLSHQMLEGQAVGLGTDDLNTLKSQVGSVNAHGLMDLLLYRVSAPRQ